MGTEALAVLVATLTERIDNLIDRLDRNEAAEAGKTDALAALDRRVTELEKFRVLLLAGGAFGGAVLGWVGNLLVGLLTR